MIIVGGIWDDPAADQQVIAKIRDWFRRWNRSPAAITTTSSSSAKIGSRRLRAGLPPSEENQGAVRSDESVPAEQQYPTCRRVTPARSGRRVQRAKALFTARAVALRMSAPAVWTRS